MEGKYLGAWDQKKHDVQFGPHTVVGWGADNHFKVERMTADVISSQSGVAGDSNVSEIYDSRVKITIVLLAESPSNQFFNGLMEGRTSSPLIWKDRSDGKEIGFSPIVRVMTPPPSERGKESKERTWVFLALNYKGAMA